MKRVSRLRAFGLTLAGIVASIVATRTKASAQSTPMPPAGGVVEPPGMQMRSFSFFRGIPVGTIVPFAGTLDAVKRVESEGSFLLCDGRPVDVNVYPELAEALGTSWGGDKSAAVHLPDFRGMTLRGVNYTYYPDTAHSRAGTARDNVGAYERTGATATTPGRAPSSAALWFLIRVK